ncbi:DUF3889 domain-containing protein [Paenibacillus kobensis]|uniref:DUF3889 domain-containing protein n=1 Tax=Paenibacillus kobensis TaxID=59841 RepID=UPI0013E34035|nr:DUF3889 domain-containing protein [Paenibacillus kobensis]
MRMKNMTNLLIAMAVFLVLSSTAASTAVAVTPIHAVRQPDYAKSGQAAVLAAKQRYSADVLDYAFEGRTPAGSGRVEYRFRLWLSKGGRDFGVRVVVTADAVSGEPIRMKWTEIKP